MNTAFNRKKGEWEIQWPGRVAKHDLVYLSPPADPMQGIPLGNGDIGALVWCENSKLIINLNKCDLWEDGKTTDFNSNDPEEGRNTTLRHAGRLIIDFKLPVFDIFYLDDFQCRLNLAEAVLELKADSPFGSVSLKAFLSHQSGLFCCELARDFKEPAPLEIRLERFGSNTFNRWYDTIKRDTSSGLQGTDSSADKNGIYVEHKLRAESFAAGCRVFKHTGSAMRCKREHQHAACAVLEGKLKQKVTLAAGVTSPTKGDPVKEVKKKLNAPGTKNFLKELIPHQAAWKSFWLRSYMDSGDDYLDNLWHLTMYYCNASQSGRYPGRFTNSLWSWNRDVQPWRDYFHWNQQQVYWPLNAAGHHDLVDSYLDLRFNGLPFARRYARKLFGTEGAFVSDVSERRGYCSIREKDNHTPVVQIAMDFWRQYLYTGDKTFLKEKALPYMLDAARFFESCFTKEADGFYHGRLASGFESFPACTDAIPEIVYARVLFSAVLQALAEAGVREPRSVKWRDIMEHAAPLALIPGGEKLLTKSGDGWKLARGYFKGDVVADDQILTAGWGVEEKRYLTGRVPNDEIPPNRDILELSILKGDKSLTLSGVTDRDMVPVPKVNLTVEYSAIFPTGLIGLGQKESAEFKAAVNTAKLYAPEVICWDPLPVVLARLGLAEETWNILRRYPGRWQMDGNGFGHEMLFRPDFYIRFFRNHVYDDVRGPDFRKRVPFPTWPFRHMDTSSMCMLSCAMNEALLQSYDGILRVGPAANPKQDARFTLHAVGGFVVSAEIVKGQAAWIHLKSLLGNKCRLLNPWSKAHVYKDQKKVSTLEDPLVDFDTEKNGCYLIVPDEKAAREWKTVPVVFAANQEPKTSADGLVGLGLPRMFARSTPDRDLLADIRNGWMFKTDEKNEGEQQQWFLDKPDSQWRPISIDRSWTRQGYDYHGAAWYSVAVPLVAHVKKADKIYLVFRSVDGYATVWINGIKMGEQLNSPDVMWARAWGLDVTDQVKKAARGFQLTVKVTKENFAAGIWRPVELRSDRW